MNKKTLDKLKESLVEEFGNTIANGENRGAKTFNGDCVNIWNFIEQVIVPAVEKEAENKSYQQGYLDGFKQGVPLFIWDKINKAMESDIELEERENNEEQNK